MTKQLHYFTLPGTGKHTVRVGVKVRDAKRAVILTRTLRDILSGTEGLAITCANAMCALRLNGEVFGHDVHIVEFTDNRAFIVDKLNSRGEPVSCVRYAHTQGSFQKAYDKKGKNLLSKMSGAEKSFIIFPPPKQVSKGAGTNRRGSTTVGTSSAVTRKRREDATAANFKGAKARMERAGIRIPR